MAPPTSRHSGFSRKAQYSAFTGYAVAVIGALVGAVLLIVSLFNPGLFANLRTSAADIVSPVGDAGASGRTGGHGVIDIVSGYFRAGAQNAKLRDEMEIARIRLKEADAVRAENVRLKALLAIEDKAVNPVAAGRLIGSTSSSTRRYAYLSVGAKDGVRPGMPVRSERGLVGRVLEAGSTSARILLLTDTESMVPVRRAGDNVVAFAEGRADGTLRIRLINLGINPLKKGDVFVTSGSGGLYRPGIAVAVASSITKDGAIARLLSDPAATDFVIVEPVWKPEAQPVISPPPQSGSK